MPYYNYVARISFAVLMVSSFSRMAVAQGNDYVRVVSEVKPSVVAVGTYQQLRQPASLYLGTGFVVADGKHVITNYHVVNRALDDEKLERFAVYIKQDNQEIRKEATLLGFDRRADLALLKIDGLPLPALRIDTVGFSPEGTIIMFTGYPLGTVLGLNPVSHRGMVSAVVNIAEPTSSDRQLSAESIRRLRDPMTIYQLDATAYPGNSGSPVLDVKTLKVIAVVNKTYVQQSKEAAISAPSGISYAIPVQYVKSLLDKHGVRP